MSLVNDMLRDLDQRRQNAPAAAGNPTEVVPGASTQKRKPTPLWLIAAMVVIVAGAAFLIWEQFFAPAKAPTVRSYAPRATSVPATPKPQVEHANLDGAAPAVVLPEVKLPEPELLRVSDVRWGRSPSGWRLFLELSGEPAFDVKQSESHLQVDLKQSVLVDPLPPLPGSLVSAMSLDPSDDGLTLILDTDRPARFQVYPLAAGGAHRLIIDLLPMPEKLTAEVSRKPSKPVQRQSAASQPVAAVAATAPANKSSLPMAKSLRQRAGQSDADQLRAATALVRKGRSDDAIVALNQFLEQHPEGRASRVLLASLLINQQQLEKAQRVIDSGLQQAPDDPSLKKLKARLLIQTGQPGQAAVLLSSQPPSVSDDSEYHQLRAAALQSDQSHREAADTYLQLLRIDSSQAPWWVGLGISLEALSQHDQARQAYRNVLQIPRAEPALSQFARSRLRGLGG